jgi:hypothetical protein
MTMLKKFLLTVAASLIVVASAAAQSMTGEWDASMNTPGGARTFKIVFVQEGEKLTGTVKRPSGDSPLEGTVVGTVVKFKYLIAYGGNPITMAVSTTLAGTEMTGSVNIAGQMDETFSAKKAVAPQ